jgi:hypothetical protein
MMRFLLAMLCVCALGNAARAQSFAVGLSLTGGDVFGSGLFSAGLPGSIGTAVRFEALNLIASAVSLRADLGLDGLAASIQWRADLSQQFNLTLNTGFGLLGYTAPALLGAVGLEYRLSSFGIALEYGLRSSFLTATPTLRSHFALSVLLFFG